MSEVKTTRNDRSVKKFLDSIPDGQMRRDSRALVSLMRRVTGESPAMWGSSIVGFGTYHYVYKSGKEGDWFLAGFSPRKQNLVVYVMSGFDRHAVWMKKLGRYTTGKSCLYLRRLEEVDLGVLEKLIRDSVRYMRARHR